MKSELERQNIARNMIYMAIRNAEWEKRAR